MDTVKVRNRDNGTVGYTIPDTGVHRSFAPNEIKYIDKEEILKLSYAPGGEYILKNCLVVYDEEVLNEAIGAVEPEYFYTDEDIKNLLLTGTTDALLDFFDYAGTGAIDIAKSLAVKLELNDIKKREIILEKTGFNVTKAIEIKKAAAEDGNGKEEEKSNGRRTAPVTTATEAIAAENKTGYRVKK